MSRQEQERLHLQTELDAAKTQAERNRMGQFATPPALARDLLTHAAALLSAAPVRFLDPAIGTGSFFSALRDVFPPKRIEDATGYEIDPHYGAPAARLWKGTGLDLRLGDFTKAVPEPRHNLVICNPPYVRHHHIVNGEKARLQHWTAEACGVRISGLAGLYCYFLGLSHAWMEEGGLAGWLIPSEFMDVNYGAAVKRYLLAKTTLLQIHRFDPADVQFTDALVSSAVVWFRKAKPPADHAVHFTFGGSLSAPKLSRTVPAAALAVEPKWTRFPVSKPRRPAVGPTVGDLFTIRRGLATGANSFFILTPEQIKARSLPHQVFRPILPSPRYLSHDEIEADRQGNPILDKRLFLLDCRLSDPDVKARYPALWNYLEEGKAKGVAARYLCRYRAPWYTQENRPPAPLVCTYLGRSDAKNGRPFRFILNHSKATVANVYLALYPNPAAARRIEADPALLQGIWAALNRLAPNQLLSEGRVYGGGLHKLEPKELANVSLPELVGLSELADTTEQTDLFSVPFELTVTENSRSTEIREYWRLRDGVGSSGEPEHHRVKRQVSAAAGVES